MLKVRNLSKIYYTGMFCKKPVFSLNDISFDVKQNEIFGIIGKNGSGKTTIARILLKLIKPDCGTIFFNSQNLLKLKDEKLRRFRKKIQGISQNYETALNPRMKIKESLKEVFLATGRKAFNEITDNKLEAMLNEVGLGKEHLNRFPAQLSGGQLQRINIARAIALRPELIIADEPTSNLDVSVQAQIIHLMLKIKKKTEMSFIFISHDRALISLICDKVAIFDEGKIIEIKSIKNAEKRSIYNAL